MFSDPLKGPIAARKIFWPLCFHNRVVIPRLSEASTKVILGNKKYL